MKENSYKWLWALLVFIIGVLLLIADYETRR